jgi:hypothetical protein
MYTCHQYPHVHTARERGPKNPCVGGVSNADRAMTTQAVLICRAKSRSEPRSLEFSGKAYKPRFPNPPDPVPMPPRRTSKVAVLPCPVGSFGAATAFQRDKMSLPIFFVCNHFPHGSRLWSAGVAITRQNSPTNQLRLTRDVDLRCVNGPSRNSSQRGLLSPKTRFHQKAPKVKTGVMRETVGWMRRPLPTREGILVATQPAVSARPSGSSRALRRRPCRAS